MDTEEAIESVHINGVPTLSGLNLEKILSSFFPQGQSKLSVVIWCPYLAGVCKAGFNCNAVGFWEFSLDPSTVVHRI